MSDERLLGMISLRRPATATTFESRGRPRPVFGRYRRLGAGPAQATVSPISLSEILN